MRRFASMFGVGLVMAAGWWGSTVSAQAPFRDRPGALDTPAGRFGAELISAIEAGDRTELERLLRERAAPDFLPDLSPAARATTFLLWRDDNGSMEARAYRVYEPPRPDEIAVLLVWCEGLEAWRGLIVEVEPIAPHRVVAVDLVPARPPTDPALTGAALAGAAPAGELDEAAALASLEQFTTKLAERGAFTGVLLVAREGRPLLERAWGERDRAERLPNQVDTKFNLGSANKMFTAVAIAQLVEQGRVAWDAPIGRYLDESWGSAVVREKAQVRHLLSHTSGLGSYFDAPFFRSSRLLYREVSDYKPLVSGDSLAFEPGARWSYSNTGFILLGAIIEAVSGENYFDYVRAHITGPAGMASTDCYDLDLVPPNLARGYFRDITERGVVWRDNLYEHVVRGGPAGGGYSNVGDLLRFDQALRSGQLIRRETFDLLASPKPDLASGSYGYGFQLFAPQLVGHGGDFAGICARFRMDLARGYTLVVLANRDGVADPVVAKAQELLARR